MFLLRLIFYTISIIFFISVSESGKIRPNFDEIFGQGWNINDREEIVIKIEQNEQNETTDIDQMGEEMGNAPNDQQKRQIILKFDAIIEKLREKRKFNNKNRVKIEEKIGKLLGTKRKKMHKWKNELNLKKNNKIKKRFYNEKKCKFIERFDEFKELHGQGKQKEFVKELGISEVTFWKWKKELMPNYHKNEHKAQKVKQYFEIKRKHPKISDKIIAEKLGIGYATMRKWKKQFAPILS